MIETQEDKDVPQDRIDVHQATNLHQSLTLPVREDVGIAHHNYEITTFRVGETYDHRHRQPSSLSWGQNLHDDLTRRDFTINALAIGVDSQQLTDIFSSQDLSATYTLTNYQLIDEFQGLDDLKDNLIRAIGDPATRFQEDALRLLRAVRLSVQLNFAIEEQTYLALKDQAHLITHISMERVRDEFLKILASDYPREGIMLLDETGLLEYVLPELVLAKGVAQSGHHLTDVWVHSLDALAACPSPDPIVRLATLLHDIGKPQTQELLDGQYTFYNHQVIGAHQTKVISRRLKLSREQAQRIFLLVRHHMFHYTPDMTDSAIRRFMRQVGLENLNDILDLREGDRLGSNARKTSWRLEEMKKRMVEQLHQPLQVRDLAIDGYDLMDNFGLTPGPILGRILNQLLESVLEDSSLNDRERLLSLAEELLKVEQSALSQNSR